MIINVSYQSWVDRSRPLRFGTPCAGFEVMVDRSSSTLDVALGLKNPQKRWKKQQKPTRTVEKPTKTHKNYGDPRIFNEKLGFNEVYS